MSITWVSHGYHMGITWVSHGHTIHLVAASTKRNRAMARVDLPTEIISHEHHMVITYMVSHTIHSPSCYFNKTE